MRRSFLDIEHTTYDIDNHPEQPLFKVLTCQGPEADERQGIGKRIEYGHSGVGPCDQDVIDGSPGQKETHRCRQILSSWHVDDGQFLFKFPGLFELPDIEAIKGSQRVVKSHSCIAIEPMTPIQIDIQSGHDDAYKPKGDRHTILEPDVDQAEYRCQYVEPMLV